MTAATDRRIALDLEVEILTDADTGVPELVVDLDEATADEARAKVVEAIRSLVGMCQLISDYEETVFDPAEAKAMVDLVESFVFTVGAERPWGDAAVAA